jgi:hypothetical protein
MNKRKIRNIAFSLAMIMLVLSLAAPVTAAGWGKPDIQIVSSGAIVGGNPAEATRNVIINWTVYLGGNKAIGPFLVQLKNGTSVIETVNYMGLSPKNRSVYSQVNMSLVPGEYNFTITADPYNTVPESKERNNNATVHVSVPKTPIAKTLKVSPNAVILKVGEERQFSAEVSDQYGQHMDASISWRLDPAGLLSYDIGWLDQTGLFTADSPGKAFVVATVAGSGVHGAAGVEVVVPTPIKIVNLAISNLAPCCNSAPYPGYPPMPAFYFSTRDFVGLSGSVINTGDETVPLATVEISLDGVWLMTITLGPIAPGETKNFQERSDRLYEISGPHELSAWVVPLAGELNENDNLGKVAVTVYQPELSNLVLPDCGIHNAGAVTGGPDTIGFKCLVRNNGPIPIYDFSFVVVTSEMTSEGSNKVIYNNTFSLGPNEEMVVSYATAQTFPPEGKTLGITFLVNHNRCAEQELTCGDNYQSIIVQPLLTPGTPVPVVALTSGSVVPGVV